MTNITDDPELVAHDPDATGVEVASGNGSVLDRVKKRRHAPDEDERAIPSWGGELRAVYKVLPRERVEDMIRHIQQRARQLQLTGKGRDRKALSIIGKDADMDFLIDACVGIIAEDADTGERERVAEGFFDMTLVDKLDPRWPATHPQAGERVPITTPQELLMYLLKWNDLSLTTESQRVARWMQDTSIPISDPQ